MSDKKYIVLKFNDNCRHIIFDWFDLKYISIRDSDTPILYTNSKSVADKVVYDLRRQQAINIGSFVEYTFNGKL